MCINIHILWIMTKCDYPKCEFRQLNTHIYKYRHKRINAYRFKRIYIYIIQIFMDNDKM